jgi:uncharacterized protein (TIGR02284 family)
MHKSAEVLNNLIIINNDRIKGYETAIEETNDEDLKRLFAEFIQNSKAAKRELEGEVIKLGEKPEDGTRTDGKIYRAWMDFKAMVTGKDRKAILSSCEYGEDVALNSYERALKEEHLSASYKPLIISQQAMIQADHDRVKRMLDAADVNVNS